MISLLLIVLALLLLAGESALRLGGDETARWQKLTSRAPVILWATRWIATGLLMLAGFLLISTKVFIASAALLLFARILVEALLRRSRWARSALLGFLARPLSLLSRLFSPLLLSQKDAEVRDRLRDYLLADPQDTEEKRLLRATLNLEEKATSSVLIPLDQWAALGPLATPEDLQRAAREHGFSRFPVRDGDHLLGYLHVKDALRYPGGEPFPRSAIRSLPPLRQDESIRSALHGMQRYGAHLGRVSEDGETLGLVALEDLLQELLP